MGIGIYALAERRVGETWEIVEEPFEFDVHKNYVLYGILTNYDGEIEPIAPARGLPSDPSPGLAQMIKEGYYFGGPVSWLSVRELAEYAWGEKYTLGKRHDQWAQRFLLETVPALLCFGLPDDVRLVVWFDC